MRSTIHTFLTSENGRFFHHLKEVRWGDFNRVCVCSIDTLLVEFVATKLLRLSLFTITHSAVNVDYSHQVSLLFYTTKFSRRSLTYLLLLLTLRSTWLLLLHDKNNKTDASNHQATEQLFSHFTVPAYTYFRFSFTFVPTNTIQPHTTTLRCIYNIPVLSISTLNPCL